MSPQPVFGLQSCWEGLNQRRNSMTKVVSGLLGVVAIASVAFAGTETYSGKEMKQVAPPPCPEWYADNEFNLSLWGNVCIHRERVAK